MSVYHNKVYLGYEEDVINEKNEDLTNYTVNKIGGQPKWPLHDCQFSSKCPLCSLHRLLIVQCYAPLENSLYHRTLYVFACVNPNCWNLSESWTCIRSQIADQTSSVNPIVCLPVVESNLTWCSGADEWDEQENGDVANGNVMNIDKDFNPNRVLRNSDDEDSNSLEVETLEEPFGKLQVHDAENANLFMLQGAVGPLGAPIPIAELEGGEEPGLVSIDKPTAPFNDINALLHQTAELPVDVRNRLARGPMQFVPKYIYVEEEWKKTCCDDDRTNELLSKYKRENEMEMPAACERLSPGAAEEEQYEESSPAHGDRLFHAFISRLRTHPGQILRYSRTEPPLLGAPLPSKGIKPGSQQEAPTVCSRCGSKLICELQLVPEFTESLQLPNFELKHLHFLSVLIFTCVESCWQTGDTLVEETVIVQPEVI